VKDVILRVLHWIIGTGERIPIWDHPWLCNAARILPTTRQHLEWPHITITNLMVTPRSNGTWSYLIFFYNNTTRSIFNTPLLALVINDVCIPGN
jgi:hypothetical protein